MIWVLGFQKKKFASSIQFYFGFLNFAKPLTHIFVSDSPSNNGLEELINQVVVSLASDTLVTQTDVRLAVQQFLNNANSNNYKAVVAYSRPCPSQQTWNQSKHGRCRQVCCEQLF